MRDRVPADIEAAQHLRRVKTLLDQALDDLVGKQTSAPCSRCLHLLAEALSELQQFSALGHESLGNRADLVRELTAVLPRIGAAQRLLAAASEFYRGWCAAGLVPNDTAAGYQGDCLTHGPALLAMEG